MDMHEAVQLAKKLAGDFNRSPRKEDFVSAGLSDHSIRKLGGTSAIILAAGLELYYASTPKRFLVDPKPPKILLIDIETSTMLVEAYGLFDQNIPITKIFRDWFMLSFASRFIGETKPTYLDLRFEKEFNDEMLLTSIHDLFSQADIVMGHNVMKFDIKKINARMLKHDMNPPSSYRVIDTLSIARKHFALSSNKLDYLAKFLGCTPKYKSRKFSQEEMWQECLKGNLEAWDENRTYNIQDIDTLEEVWNKLKKWDKTINFSVYSQKDTCPCGASEFEEGGERYTNGGIFRKISCASCGYELVKKENLISKDSGISKL